MSTMFNRPSSFHFGVVTLASGHGGVSRVARNSARVLIENGREVSLLSLVDSSPVEISGCRSTTVRGSRFKFVAKCHGAAVSHGQFMYDFIGTARAHPRLPGLRRPYILWIHGIEVWCDLTAERKNVLDRASIILSNSAYTLARLEEKHGRMEQARVCRLATEEDEAAAMPATFDGPPTALIVARMNESEFYKGHRELIEVWPKVVSAVPGARLVIVGGGDAKGKIIDLASRSKAPSSIEIKGFLSEAELAQVWQETNVFAMPSRGEGFGLVYIEAMRHGIPVIASVHDAGQEVNLDGVTGYNVDLDRPGELEERLIELLRDPDRARKMGRAGEARWRQHFRYEVFKQRLIEALS